MPPEGGRPLGRDSVAQSRTVSASLATGEQETAVQHLQALRASVSELRALRACDILGVLVHTLGDDHDQAYNLVVDGSEDLGAVILNPLPLYPTSATLHPFTQLSAALMEPLMKNGIREIKTRKAALLHLLKDRQPPSWGRW